MGLCLLGPLCSSCFEALSTASHTDSPPTAITLLPSPQNFIIFFLKPFSCITVSLFKIPLWRPPPVLCDHSPLSPLLPPHQVPIYSFQRRRPIDCFQTVWKWNNLTRAQLHCFPIWSARVRTLPNLYHATERFFLRTPVSNLVWN